MSKTTKPNANVAPKSRVTRPRAVQAPRAARKKAPLAAEAILEFTGSVAVTNEAPVEILPPAPPAPIAAAPAPAPAPKIEPIVIEVGQSLEAPAPRVSWRRTPWSAGHTTEVVKGLIARMRRELKARAKPWIAPIFARFPWLARRFLSQ